MTKINQYFDENIKVIWYEVDNLKKTNSYDKELNNGRDQEAIKLFTRLNIGKIPLTSAELVKAMFLNKANIKKDMSIQEKNIIERKQKEISLQWDNIERDLHKDSLWYFLSNDSKMQYKTRIDLILNLISEKTENEKEEYYTFFYFDQSKKRQALDDIWLEIQHTFLILKDWFENHDFTIKSDTLLLLKLQHCKKYLIFQRNNKNEFDEKLDQLIKESINYKKSWAELNYENNTDYEKINRLLLLSMLYLYKKWRKTQWFPLISLNSMGKIG